MKDLILIGASGLAREVVSADQGEYRVVGVVDDRTSSHGGRAGGVEVLGGIALTTEFDADLLICIGSGVARRSVADRLASLGVAEQRFATFADSSVRIPATCAVGAGSILLAGVVLTADVSIGRHVVAMPNTTFTHDNRIGDFVTVASGVSLGGSVAVGEAAYLGMNAAIRQQVRVGAEAVVGMGAVVLTDIPEGETWAGVPAHQLTAREAS